MDAKNNRGRHRQAGAPGIPGAGRKREIEQFRLPVAVAEQLRSVVGDDLVDALSRIGASAAADPAGTRAALAPLLEIPAWDGKEVL